MEKTINDHCLCKNRLKAEKEILSEYHYNGLSLEKAEARYRKLYKIPKDSPVCIGDKDRIRQITKEIKNHNSSIKPLKDELLRLLQSHRATRKLRDEYVVDKNVISVFESMLTRTLGMQTGQLYDDFMVICT